MTGLLPFPPIRFFGIVSIIALLAQAIDANAQAPDVGPGVCVDVSHKVAGYSCGDSPTGSGSYARTYSRSSSGDGGASARAAARHQAALQHQQRMNQIMLNGFQSLMNNFWAGYQQGLEYARQANENQLNQSQGMLRRQLQAQQKEAEAARAALERNRKSLAAARDRISGTIRSMSASGIPMRPTLNVREETGAFGTRTLKPRAIGDPVDMDIRARVTCGQSLLQASGTMAGGDPGPGLIASLKEAAFLSRQAGVAASGGTMQVACPSNSDTDAVLDQIGPDDLDLAKETVKRQADMFAALYDHVAGGMEQMLDIRVAAKESAEALKDARRNHAEAQTALEALQSGSTAAAPSPQDQSTLPDEDKRRALEEAMKALQESENVLGEIEGIHQQNVESLAKTENDLNRMQDLMGKIGTDPEAMPSLRQALGLSEDAAQQPKG